MDLLARGVVIASNLYYDVVSDKRVELEMNYQKLSKCHHLKNGGSILL
jgi:hypothetical protein